jgi:hypothetical protein
MAVDPDEKTRAADTAVRGFHGRAEEDKVAVQGVIRGWEEPSSSCARHRRRTGEPKELRKRVARVCLLTRMGDRLDLRVGEHENRIKKTGVDIGRHHLDDITCVATSFSIPHSL